MSTKERLVGLQPTAESFGTDTRSAGKFGFSTGFHENFELGILNYDPCARVRQLRHKELAKRVEGAQCLRSPQKLQIFGDPEDSMTLAQRLRKGSARVTEWRVIRQQHT